MNGFLQVLRGEWTKFRSVRSTALCLLAAGVVTVLMSLFSASLAKTDVNDGPQYEDQAQFVHKSLTGDGSVVARVVSQRNSHEWAKAGLLIKASTDPGAPYAAVMVTPAHGVRMETGFDTDIAGGGGTAPRWLRLTRTGDRITGAESADGLTWNDVATVTVALPQTAQIGLFVGSPPKWEVTRTGSGVSTTIGSTVGTAIFDGVTAPPGAWTNTAISSGGPGRMKPLPNEPGDFRQSGETYTITGSGDIAGYGIASWQSPGDEDVVMLSLFGVNFGLMAVVALGVLFIAAEYRTGLIRTTFAASPRRGRVLAAKTLVLGGSALVVGVVAAVIAFLVSQPMLRSNGYNPPAYPHATLLDGSSIRAVFGTGLFLAVIAVFSLGVATIRRRTVGAIVFVIALMLVPQIVVPVISPEASIWVNRLTPVAGLAVQQTTDTSEFVIGPWAGMGVLAGYAAVALGLAFVQLRRRDA
jgi:ABC-type transport system involved in multi-copper enzyme maturation permease subunit/regulation of enolase protein 1 (concanavalin A-like superfamily)